jgi:hypothetical protein
MRPNPAVNAGARRLGFARATVAGYLRSLGVIGHVRAEDAKLRQLIAAFLVVPSLSIAATPGITADAALQIVNGCVAHAKGRDKATQSPSMTLADIPSRSCAWTVTSLVLLNSQCGRLRRLQVGTSLRQTWRPL